MPQLVQIMEPKELERLSGGAGVTLLRPGDLTRHAPDVHWVLVSREGTAEARCSLWWRRTPPHPKHRVGVIGHYAARDGVSGGTLLRHACEQLMSQQCTLAVGPMDGNTWWSYRLVTERGSEPPFFLEPTHPDDWPLHFTENGFNPLVQYASTLNSDLGRPDPAAERVARRMEGCGIRIRPLDVGRFEDDLRRIYSVSTESFRDHLFYSPLEEAAFMVQYLPFRSLVRPELVLLAERDASCVGFLFAVPDHLQTRRNGIVDTIIIKTLAILPGREYAGLGSLLLWRLHTSARALGFRRAIHALMAERSFSFNLSAKCARRIRRYTLFARTLGP